MKKYLILTAVAAVLACACTPEKPAECYVSKSTVEFAGNAFSYFTLGSDVKLYTVQNPNNSSEWTVQAVVPVRKEVNKPLEDLSINIVPLDDHGVRIREGFVLEGEDLPNLIPVFNAGNNVERVVVFSVADEDKKYLSASEASQLLESIKGVRMDFNVPVTSIEEAANEILDAASAVVSAVGSAVGSAVNPALAAPAAPAASAAPKTPKEYPMTLDGLCRKFGVYGLLSQYENAIRRDDGKAAKRIEDQLWAIEKRVKNDKSIPESLRDLFEDYIEDKEDEIEDRY